MQWISTIKSKTISISLEFLAQVWLVSSNFHLLELFRPVDYTYHRFKAGLGQNCWYRQLFSICESQPLLDSQPGPRVSLISCYARYVMFQIKLAANRKYLNTNIVKSGILWYLYNPVLFQFCSKNKQQCIPTIPHNILTEQRTALWGIWHRYYIHISILLIF